MATLSEEEMRRLDERVQEEEINLADIPGLERCRFCQYSLVMDVPAAVNKVFQCPQCCKVHLFASNTLECCL